MLTSHEDGLVRSMSPEAQRHFINATNQLQRAQKIEAAREHFMPFVKLMWPGFIEGRHHAIMADAFDRICDGTLKRLIINMPPRHTKSEFGSYLLPAFFLGRFPDKKIIQSSHTSDLAVGFGRKVRDLVSESHYHEVFPDLRLRKDAKAAGRWITSKEGEYFAIGVGGAVTGKGGDLLIIDDPHSEQEGASLDPKVFDKAYEWYTSGPRQRLQPGGAIVLIMTRWGVRDMTGRIIKASMSRDGMDEWEVIEFPALMPSGKPLWPEFWPLKELEALRDGEIPVSKWQAQYQQNPTSEEGAIIKREWWQIWEKSEPPQCEFVIQSWDTAFLKTERADYSACTTWGVFYIRNDDDKLMANIILLDGYKARLEFPALKKIAFEMYDSRRPDSLIVEAKAAGLPLIFEMRSKGIPVQQYTPSRGSRAAPNDKVARVNAISDLFSSGIVWAPQTRWADEVITEFAEFPMGEHDDYVDSGTQALLRFRQGGFVALESDEEEEPRPHRRANYY